MSSIDINQLLSSIEGSIASLAGTSLQEYLKAAEADGQTIVDSLKDDLREWTAEVSSGDLTMEDLGFLIKEEQALVEITALKAAGLTEVRIDEFKTGVVNIITGAIVGLIKI
jgi:hypothetical protein